MRSASAANGLAVSNPAVSTPAVAGADGLQPPNLGHIA
jgi:hypothetical protein